MCLLLIPTSLNNIGHKCDLALLLMSLGGTINCSSNLTADGSAVTVMCSYDSTRYSGYSVCILNQMDLSPKCISSTESGLMVTVNGTVNGELKVFINPTWRSSPNFRGEEEGGWETSCEILCIHFTHPQHHFEIER